MSNQAVSKVGVIIYALVMAVFGVHHLMSAASMSAYVPSYFPGGGALWIYVSGAAFILAAIAFVVNIRAKLAALLLALLLLIILGTIQVPGLITAKDSATHGMYMVQVLKDLGLLGGALMIAGRT